MFGCKLSLLKSLRAKIKLLSVLRGKFAVSVENCNATYRVFTRSSKLPANVFKIHVLIAGRLLDRINTLLLARLRFLTHDGAYALTHSRAANNAGSFYYLNGQIPSSLQLGLLI